MDISFENIYFDKGSELQKVTMPLQIWPDLQNVLLKLKKNTNRAAKFIQRRPIETFQPQNKICCKTQASLEPGYETD